MATGKGVRLVHAALNEADGEIILRGVLDPDCLEFLQVPEYQREILPATSLTEMTKAFVKGSVPDIDLGMRGERYEFSNDAYTLIDPVFIIDGLQRVNAAKAILGRDPSTVRLGATVHFGTTEEWERERFRILNAERVKLSPNVLLRNYRHDYSVINLLYGLCTGDRAFVLYNRVCWDQRMARDHFLTAATFVRTIGVLHSHMRTGTRHSQAAAHPMMEALQNVTSDIGPNVFRQNVKAFFDLLDECWGVKRVAFKTGATYLRHTFLLALTEMLSDHLVFWNGNRLKVSTDYRRKLATFPVRDPQVVSLSSAGGAAKSFLAQLMINHINSSKRTRRLVSRHAKDTDTVEAAAIIGAITDIESPDDDLTEAAE